MAEENTGIVAEKPAVVGIRIPGKGGSLQTRDTSKEKPYRKVTEKELGQILEKSGGFVSVAAREIGTSVTNVIQRVHKSKYLQQVLAGVRATVVDIAESTMVKAVKDGDITAAIFTLKCLGKDRGWVEKQAVEVDHVNDRPPIVFSLIAQEKVDEAKRMHEESAGS